MHWEAMGVARASADTAEGEDGRPVENRDLDLGRPLPPAPEVLRAALAYRPGAYERFAKPVIDWFGALLLLVVTLPLLSVTALAVWVVLGEPVIFRQDRVGKGGRVFPVFKFRTMAPDRRKQPIPYLGHDRRVNHKDHNDPRLNLFGRLLRKWSVDEIPQLWNVVRGEMSLVGPRPELEEIVRSKYEDWQHLRHRVRPGITGLWQIREHRDGTMWQHTRVDLEYLTRISLKEDLRILLSTPTAALGRRRAF